MGEGAIGGPFNVIAGTFKDEEGFAAALLAFVVNALFDGEVEDGAR